MPNFRELKAWQCAKALAGECHKAVRKFPGGERNALGDQLLRASLSVPLNIAEGSGRKGPREFRRFLDIARGSLTETQGALELAREFGYVSPVDFEDLNARASETARILWGLLRATSRNARQPLSPLAP